MAVKSTSPLLGPCWTLRSMPLMHIWEQQGWSLDCHFCLSLMIFNSRKKLPLHSSPRWLSFRSDGPRLLHCPAVRPSQGDSLYRLLLSLSQHAHPILLIFLFGLKGETCLHHAVTAISFPKKDVGWSSSKATSKTSWEEGGGGGIQDNVSWKSSFRMKRTNT